MSFQGVCVATVTDVVDPDGEGRIRVGFPMLDGAPKSTWAPVVRTLAGDGRGMWYVPEVGDEALVAFEHGDFDHPFILGYLWNGADKPPSSGIDEHVRRIQSVSGHQFDLDDRDGDGAVVIKTAGGSTIELHDKAGQVRIAISTSGGHRIELSDQPGDSHISLSTAGGQKVELVDQPVPSITVSGSAAMVKVEALQASVQATSMLQITAPMTTFSGVVQAQTVITNAVVSTSYTPGAGNIW